MREAVYTKQDLTIMQGWPLERKIMVTQAKIIEWYHYYGGRVSCSFSGGKDSTILVDLARRAFPDIPAAFVDTGLEYPEIPFTKVIGQYGYPVIFKDVARRIRYARQGSEWAIRHMNAQNRDGSHSWFNERYLKWRFLLEAPFLISDHCCVVMKERPIHEYVRETGAMQIVGTMACESVRRQTSYLKTGCNAFHKAIPTSPKGECSYSIFQML